MLSPVTSIAGTPLVIDPIMATSLQSACAAAASTSGRTPRACWSPRRATARLTRGAAAARVHPPGPRARARRGDPGGPDRRDRERRGRAARAGRAGWRADDPRRRHRGDPARRQPRRVLRRDPRARRGRGLRARRRGGGAAGVPGRHADARPAAAGTRRGGGRRRRLDRDRRRDADRRRRMVASFPFGSGFLAEAYLGGDPPSASKLDAVRAHAPRALAEIEPGPVDIAVAVGGSAASLRRLVGDELDAESLERALRVLTQRSGRGRRVSLRPRGPARAADARRPARARCRRAGARAAAPDRPRRPSRGRPAGSGGPVTTRSRKLHRECDHVAAVTDATPHPRPSPRQISRIRRCITTGSCRWLQFNERVLELAEDASIPLLERVKFCAIYSSNLDEFFMVRVAGLHDQIDAGIQKPLQDGRTPRETINEIRRIVREHPRASRTAWTTTCGPRWPSTGSGSSATPRSTARSARAWTSASAARSSRS